MKLFVKLSAFVASSYSAAATLEVNALLVTQATNKGRKIVGEYVEPNSIPHQVSVQTLSGFHFCGGSLYDEQTVITASHCCDGRNAQDVQVVVGEYDFFCSGYFNPLVFCYTERTMKVQSIIMHKDYGTPKTYSNDICLLILEKSPFHFNSNFAAVPTQGEKFTGMATVFEWGSLLAHPPLYPAVMVPLLSDQICDSMYILGGMDPATMLCAIDSCQGIDSGGPLICEGGKHCGILIGCADKRYPGVYAETAAYVDWIKENVNACGTEPTDPGNTTVEPNSASLPMTTWITCILVAIGIIAM